MTLTAVYRAIKIGLLASSSFLLGVLVSRYVLGASFNIDTWLQVAATLSIPFVYFLLVERHREARRAFTELVTRELDSVIDEIRITFDDVSRMHTSSEYSESLMSSTVPLTLHLSLRIGNLESIAKIRGDDDLSTMIKGVGRFVGEYRGHLLNVPILFAEHGHVPEAHFYRILDAYALIIHNYQLTLLHANGLISKNAKLVQAPLEGQVT